MKKYFISLRKHEDIVKGLEETIKEKNDMLSERVDKENELKNKIKALETEVLTKNAKVQELEKQIAIYEKYYKTNEPAGPAERAAVRAELEIEKLRSEIIRNKTIELSNMFNVYQSQAYWNSLINAYPHHGQCRLY